MTKPKKGSVKKQRRCVDGPWAGQMVLMADGNTLEISTRGKDLKKYCGHYKADGLLAYWVKHV